VSGPKLPAQLEATDFQVECQLPELRDLGKGRSRRAGTGHCQSALECGKIFGQLQGNRLEVTAEQSLP